MTWTKFNIKTVYNDGYSTPIENAFVLVRFANSNNQLDGNFFSGYTNQNGIITISSNTATTNSTNILYRAIDENKCLQEGDFSETIVNNTQYLIKFDIDGNGIEWNYLRELYDALYGAITYYGTKQINPKKIELYAKNRDETYSLVETYTSSTVTINVTYKTIEFLAKAYRYANDNNSIFWTQNVNYKEALWPIGGGDFVCENYYDINIPKINDTINWNDSLKTLNNSNILITLTSNTQYQTVVSAETFSNSEYIRMYLSETIFNGAGITRFLNVVNPEFNNIKIYKNHYNEYENGCVISADTNGNYMFIVSGLSENEPIILEREPNVCMINEDLFDYVVSLTGIRPDMSNFSDYGTDADLMKKVGVSKLPFYNDWISAITQYLPQQYQGQTASTLDDFKLLFVSEISTDYVQTNYASSLEVENQYLENSNHGYVWDRCFIPEEKEIVENCLTFMPINNICNISFNYVPGPRTLFDFEYSLNGGDTWNAYSFGQNGYGQIVTLSPGGNTSIKFRRALSNTGTTLSTDINTYYYFAITGTCTAAGNITSLLDGYGLSTTELDSNYCFIHLFKNCTGLRNSPELPETTLTEGCFFGMFDNCTSLLNGPETLPIETLADYCYANMFAGCTSLTAAPQLPATTLAGYCYANMFQGCTSLTTTPALQETALTQYCYYGMFSACTSLTTILNLPATVLADYCYSNMFAGCTSLTTILNLPATTLADYCYANMFQGCTSLTTAPQLPATTLDDYCYANMFAGCTSLTTAPQLPARTLALGCYEHMFGSCSSLTNARTLSAATALTESCFEDMFYGCTSLSTAPTISRSHGMQKNCFKNMFHGCTSLTTMPYTGSTFPWQSHAYGCYEGMFENCTSLSNTPSTIFGYNARDYCFKRMFAGCTSITNPIRLYANNLGTVSGACESMFEGCASLISGITADSLIIGPNSYKNMFKNCGKLVCVEAKFTGTTSGNFTMQNASAYTYNWVYGVSSNGLFYHKNGTPGAPGGYGVHWIPNGWTAQLLA